MGGLTIIILRKSHIIAHTYYRSYGPPPAAHMGSLAPLSSMYRTSPVLSVYHSCTIIMITTMLLEIYDTLKKFFWLIVVAWIAKSHTSCNLYICELLYLLTRGAVLISEGVHCTWRVFYMYFFFHPQYRDITLFNAPPLYMICEPWGNPPPPP